LVVQAALFAAFLSAFLIELLSRLEPDPMDIIQDVLIYQTQMMRNLSLGPYVPATDFSPPDHIVVVNALFYASLGVMILAAFIAMLIKSWIREFDRGLRAMSLPEQRAKTREFRYLGMERWKLPEMVAILPFLIQISLLLFAIGLVLFLFHISKPSFGVTTAIFGIGMLYYSITTSISVFVTSSPFHSPLSRTLGKVYQHVHAYFCPDIDNFLSKSMDTTPATALGRASRYIHIIIHRSRPYLEKDFVEPVTATTMDEVQLSTAASSLQRIHDSAPDSQHSEALQSSVWLAAGGAANCIPPSFDLPSWITDKQGDEEYFSCFPPTILAALGAISLRSRRKISPTTITTATAVLQRTANSEGPEDLWLHLVVKVVGCRLDYGSRKTERECQADSNSLINIIRRKRLHRNECLWLLNTLSELHSKGWLSLKKASFIGICLPMLMDSAPEWSPGNSPDIVLLEAVATFAAISCTSDRTNRLTILSSSRDHPWLLLNIRNTNLISRLYEEPPSDDYEQLTSLLFLIVYALIYRDSNALAVQYFRIITAKGDLPLYTSALTAIAPSMTDRGLSTISWMLVAPQAQELAPGVILDSYPPDTLEDIFDNHDKRLGISENPDPNIIAILLVLSNRLPSSTRKGTQEWNMDFKNPWLRLVARVVTQLNILDGSDLPMGLFHDHRVHSMIAALSLLRYARGYVTHYTESLLLASFLQLWEPTISSLALEYYVKTAISYSDPAAPSCFLSAAVSSAFNAMLPEEQLWRRWKILGIFVDRFETLSVEWRRNFAEGFFSLSCRPLPRLRGDNKSSTAESELEAILTWEYFHEKEQESELTDSQLSGLDWMAMAWSLHLAQQPRRKTAGSRHDKVQLENFIGLEVNEEFVFRALCKLLDAAPYYQIIPIIPKLREFTQWFDDTKLPEYRSMISTRVSEAVSRYEELQVRHRFRKFHCRWYI
jgi:hypothetical protein